MLSLWRVAGIVAFGGALAGCVTAPREAGPVQFAWVDLGDAGVASVRAAVAPGAACPEVQVDQRGIPTLPRGPASGAVDSAHPASPRQASFDVTVCEATLPAAVRDLRVGSLRLPAPVASPLRIVWCWADSGCRLDQEQLPRTAAIPLRGRLHGLHAAAARLHPDLVIHVGDYHYRERPCPAAESGCAGSPWGYGWDAWRADFFEPAAPLLAAAPWVFVRGNHEECARAGQGWFRLLAPEPYDASRSCDDPGQDDVADFTPPYAVPIGPALQPIVFDSARAGNAPLDAAKPKDALTRDTYLQETRRASELASRPGVQSWFTSHHPVLAFAPGGPPPGSKPFLRGTRRCSRPCAR